MTTATACTTTTSEASSLWSQRRELLALLVMVSIYFFSFFQRAAVPGTIFNQIQTDLHLTATGVTALGAIMLYIYGSAQLFVGLMADRFGGGRTLVAGGLVLALGSIAFPLAQTPWQLYVSRAVTGLGAAFMYLSLVKEIDGLFGPRYFPVLIGPMLFLGYGGGLAATVPFDWAARTFGWRQSLLVVGLATLACVALTALVLRRLNHPARTGQSLSLRPLWDAVRNRRCWPVLLFVSVNQIYFLFQFTVGKKLLEDVAGLSSAAAARVLFVMTGLANTLIFFTGAFVRATGNRRRPHVIASAVVLLTAMLLMLAGVWLRAAAWVFVAGYMLLAISVALHMPAITIMKELNSRAVVAQSISVMNGCAYLAMAILANVSGAVLDRFAAGAVVTPARMVYPPQAYAMLMLVLTLLAATSLLTAWRIPETHRESAAPGQETLG